MLHHRKIGCFSLVSVKFTHLLAEEPHYIYYDNVTLMFEHPQNVQILVLIFNNLPTVLSLKKLANFFLLNVLCICMLFVRHVFFFHLININFIRVTPSEGPVISLTLYLYDSAHYSDGTKQFSSIPVILSDFKHKQQNLLSKM